MIFQPSFSLCQAPQSKTVVSSVQRRYLKPAQKPPVFTISIVFKEEKVEVETKVEKVSTEEIEIIAPVALRPTVREILENLVQYTVDSDESQRQENIERIVHVVILFYDSRKLFKADLADIANLIKARFSEPLLNQFNMQIDKAIEQKFKGTRQHSESSAPMSKKPKSSDQEQK
jgi:hypothetical protein